MQVAKGFEFLKKLGAGRASSVYVVRAPAVLPEARFVVLKLLVPGQDLDWHRFLDEARIARRLHHENIVRVHDAFESGGKLFLEMEWIHGRSLTQVLGAASGHRLSPALACRIARDLCLALHAAHRATDEKGQPLGLIHRDVTPNNVMLSFDGAVKVIDFGIARAASNLAQVTELQATPWYLAPERAAEILRGIRGSPEGKDLPEEERVGPEPDYRSDLFCAAILLHELLTGKSPFPPVLAEPGRERIEMLRHIVRGELLLKDIPEALRPILLKALARRREDRYESGEELAKALGELPDIPLASDAQLAQLLDALFPGARAAELQELERLLSHPELRDPTLPGREVQTSEATGPGPRRGRKWLLALGLTAVAALAAGGGWLLWPRTPPSQEKSSLIIPKVLIETQEGTLDLTLQDDAGHPLADRPVAFEVKGTYGRKTLPARTDAQGEARVQLDGWPAPDLVTIIAVVDPGARGVALERQTLRFTSAEPAGGTWVAGAGAEAEVGKPIAFAVRLADAHDHPVVDWPVELRLEERDAVTTARTDSQGVARFERRTTQAGAFTAKAWFPPMLGSQEARQLEPNPVRWKAGEPVVADGGAAPGSTVAAAEDPAKPAPVADGKAGVPLTIVARDGFGNPAPGRSVDVQVGSGSRLTLPDLTNESGAVTWSVTSTRAGAHPVKVWINAIPHPIELEAQVAFSPGPPDRKHSMVTAKPERVVAAGKSRTTLEITVRDAHDNPLPGVPVRLQVTGKVSPEGFQPKGKTNEQGVFTTALASSAAGEKAVAAWVTVAKGRELALARPAKVSFVAGSPMSRNSKVAAEPRLVEADGKTKTRVTVLLKDENGNPVSNQNVAIEASSPNVSPGRCTGPSDAAGQLSCDFTSSQVEKKVVFSARVGGSGTGEGGEPLAGQAEVEFTVGAPDAALFSLSLSGDTTTVVAGKATTLNIKLVDRFGHGLPGWQVRWASESNPDVLQPAASTTDQEGRASTSFMPIRAGFRTLSASVAPEGQGPGLNKQLMVKCVEGPLDPKLSKVTPVPRDSAKDATAYPLQLTAIDANQNPMTGAKVTWSSDVAGDTFEPTADPRATVVLRPSGPGPRRITATVEKKDSRESWQVNHTVVVDAPSPPKGPPAAPPDDGGSEKTAADAGPPATTPDDAGGITPGAPTSTGDAGEAP